MENDKTQLRDLDWFLFHRKEVIGQYIVQFEVGNAADRLLDVGHITEIFSTDLVFCMKVEGNCWMLYNWDNSILPYVTEENGTITVYDKIAGLRFIVLKKKS